MKKFISEFKEFISRGNVFDLAIGMIIGSAFTAIVTSLVQDILTPIIGLILRACGISEDFASWTVAGFGVGSFINALISFFLIALTLFLIIRSINKAKELRQKNDVEEEKEPEPAPVTDIDLLTEIRDLLAKKDEE